MYLFRLGSSFLTDFLLVSFFLFSLYLITFQSQMFSYTEEFLLENSRQRLPRNKQIHICLFTYIGKKKEKKNKSSTNKQDSPSPTKLEECVRVHVRVCAYAYAYVYMYVCM